MAKNDYDKMNAKERAFALFTACEEARRNGYDGKNSHEAALACWNEWAEPLLAERAKLEADGEWAVKTGFDNEIDKYVVVGKNEETRDFLARANIDADSFVFIERGWVDSDDSQPGKEEAGETGKTIHCQLIKFDNFQFPGKTFFLSATFRGNASFNEVTFKGNTSFASATFKGDVSFLASTFQGCTLFGGAIFKDSLSFSQATFCDYLLLGHTIFEGDVSFFNSVLKGIISFNSSTFRGEANFMGATFANDAYFNGTFFESGAYFNSAQFQCEAQFNSSTINGTATFRNASFMSDASFAHATCNSCVDFSQASFHSACSFTALHSVRAINLAGASFTSQVPQFTQAHFTESPRLDHLHLPMVDPLSGRLPSPEGVKHGKKVDQDDVAAFTALRHLALKGEDHETERMAFKGEMRSLRALKGAGFWYSLFSYAYDAITDFGASYLRPLVLWGLLLASMMFHYQSASTVSLSERPENCDSPYEHAALLSLHNGLLFATAGQRPFVLKAYHCLFGKKGTAPNDVVPPAGLGLWGILQTSLSAVLIFFILLALRNRFKIK